MNRRTMQIDSLQRRYEMLLQDYQRERDKQKQASKEEFYAWLIEHKFQEVKESIASNSALSFEIETLLQMNQDNLLERFDDVDKKLAAFCEKFVASYSGAGNKKAA